MKKFAFKFTIGMVVNVCAACLIAHADQTEGLNTVATCLGVFWLIQGGALVGQASRDLAES